MANRNATMNKIREILRLHEESKCSIRVISKTIKLSRPVITEYLNKCKDNGLIYKLAKDMPDDELEQKLQSKKELTPRDQRYTELANRFPHFAQELKRVGVTRFILWEEYRAESPDGYGYSQFCDHFKAWLENQELSMPMEHKAGDKMYVDFAGEKLSIVDRFTGEIIPVEVFVAVLGASQLTYVEATTSQKKHDFITANVNALHYIGGTPEAIVPDNLKSGVTKAHRYEPDINPEYIHFARHYNLTILPARPNKPRDKPLVEGGVKIVYQRIYAHLRDRVFHSLPELNAAIREELERYNNRVMKGYGKSRRELFEEIEKPVLRPLPAERHIPKEYCNSKAYFNYHIFLLADKHYYSVPYQYRNKKMDVFYSAKTVEIYHRNVRIAFHERDYRVGKYTTVTEHMPPQHRYLNDWNPEKFLSWADDIGPDVRTLIEIVLNMRQHPEQNYKTCLGILSLAKKYGRDRLNAACRKALYLESYSCKTVGNILKNNRDREETDGGKDSKLPVHENIRGNEYYH